MKKMNTSKGDRIYCAMTLSRNQLAPVTAIALNVSVETKTDVLHGVQGDR